MAWPLTKQETFNPSWQGDPLLSGAEQSLQFHLDQLQLPTKMINLLTKQRDHPLAQLGIKYASSRNDAAEESLAIFLTIPTNELHFLPHANICSLLVSSAKLLMETQGASMQHFQGFLPRQRTWHLLMDQVGERAFKIGQEGIETGLYSITGDIIMQMNVAVQKWKDIFKQKESQIGDVGLLNEISSSDEPRSWNHTAPIGEIDMDNFWAEDPLDTFFANLFSGQEDDMFS